MFLITKLLNYLFRLITIPFFSSAFPVIKFRAISLPGGKKNGFVDFIISTGSFSLFLPSITSAFMNYIPLNFSTIILTILLLLPMAGICLTPSSKDHDGKKYPAFWQPSGRVDGTPAEWPMNAFFLSKDGTILYAMGNDSLRLYLCMRVLSEQQQVALMQNGIILWFDPSGKKKSVCSVRIPCKPLRPEQDHRGKGGPPSGEIPGGQMPPGFKQTMDRNHQRFSGEMSLEGFNDPLNGIWAIGREQQPATGAIALDSAGVMTLEVSVPLNALPLPEKASPFMTFGFTLEVPQRGMGNRPEGGPGGGGQGRPGGGDFSGSGGGGMPGGGTGGMPGGGNSGMPGEQGMSGGPGGGMGGPPGNSGSTGSETVKMTHRFSLARRPE